MKYPKDKYILNINDLSKLKEVYIYGTGISSQKLKELIKRNSIDIKILGFVDSYKKTTIIDNLKIYNIKKGSFLWSLKNPAHRDAGFSDFQKIYYTNYVRKEFSYGTLYIAPSAQSVNVSVNESFTEYWRVSDDRRYI